MHAQNRVTAGVLNSLLESVTDIYVCYASFQRDFWCHSVLYNCEALLFLLFFVQ